MEICIGNAYGEVASMMDKLAGLLPWAKGAIMNSCSNILRSGIGRPLRSLCLSGTLAIALLASASFAEATIIIGQAAPFTGTNAWIGMQVSQAAEIAVADINAAGGLLGEDVQIVSADDFCDPDQGVAAAQQLVAAGAVFVAGHLCSGASIAASEVYQKAGVIMISPGSTSPELTELGRSIVFRVCGRDDRQGEVAAEYLAKHWADKKIAILDDGGVYGVGLADVTAKSLNKLGVRETLRLTYTPGLADYFDVVDKLKAAQIDVIYVGGYASEAALILRAARELGVGCAPCLRGWVGLRPVLANYRGRRRRHGDYLRAGSGE